MKMAMLFLAAMAILFAFDAACAAAKTGETAAQGRQRLALDRGWKFHLGDIPFPVIKGQNDSYNNAKAGTAHAAAAIKYNDTDWRVLDLPHDWACESDFSEKNNLSQGYRARGFGWYRRYFKLDPANHGKHIELQFDGVSTNCTVWVNGIVSHRNWCGYTGFAIDITPFAKYGNDENVIAVRVDADTQEGWWYEGAGIYRHTWLEIRDPVHIQTDGVFANPIKNADGTWTLPIEVTLESSAHETATAEVESTLIDAAGKTVGTAKATVADIAPFQEPVAKCSIAVASPTLWSLETPVLYEVRTVVRRDGKEVDAVSTHCGFRTIRFDADKGFFLNDKHVKLMGTCNHQDHAGVGVAMPDSLWEYRVRRLKEMGANANRCSHNPPAAEFLDQCDRQGMLVMDENRNFNTTDEYARQLQWLVRRDRNRPCVILWSVFNEEPMQGSVQGYEMVRKMAAVVKSLDTTRPVTAAQSGAMMNKPNASQAADVAGFNYQIGGYDAYHQAYPTKPITSSEDTSAVMTRGEYVTDHHKCLIDSYDTQAQPWGATHCAAWKAIAERPFLAGGFVWTGFDYHGETQPLQWPATSSSFGCMDLCGFPKAAYYIHQAQWLSRPMVQLIPHWNWKGKEGKPVWIKAFTNADAVALFLNGKPQGEKPVDKYEFVRWDNVLYEPGKLEAVAKNNGVEVARCVVETTGEPAAVQLIADRPNLAGDGWDAQPITVQVVDDKGRVVPEASNLVKFEISGPGVIIGLGNGDPTCHEPEKGDHRSVFHGLAQVIVQSTRGSGKFVLRATADGLKPAETTIDVQAVPARAEVP
jgi:beta-galactosidase